jgi:hypothetical protein
MYTKWIHLSKYANYDTHLTGQKEVTLCGHNRHHGHHVFSRMSYDLSRCLVWG